MTPERIDALEFKVAHLERALQELSDVLYRQQKELESLRNTSEQLIAQMHQVADPAAEPTSDEVPPHY